MLIFGQQRLISVVENTVLSMCSRGVGGYMLRLAAKNG